MDSTRALPVLVRTPPLGYLSYFPILVFGPLVLWLRGNRDGARRTVLHTMIAFVPCYLAFVLFPVAGPN